MPALNQQYIAILSPLIDPFERSPEKSIEKDLLEGEKHNDEFIVFIHDGIENNKPIQYVEITTDELHLHKILKGGSFADRCFLWVIDSTSIKIIYEKTRNVLRSAARPEKPWVCHTNITGCSKAYIGGEMYFCEDGNIYVNFKSDRYGRPETEEKKQVAIQYMIDVGYKNIIRTEDFF